MPKLSEGTKPLSSLTDGPDLPLQPIGVCLIHNPWGIRETWGWGRHLEGTLSMGSRGWAVQGGYPAVKWCCGPGCLLPA